MLFSNLLKERLRDYLASHPNVHEDTIRIKISRDGARMTCNFSFILMSFALLDLGDDVMAAKGNHTMLLLKSIAPPPTSTSLRKIAVECAESYSDKSKKSKRLNT